MMRMSKAVTALSVLMFLNFCDQASAATGYHLASSISIPGAGGWDYLYADSDDRRLYVSHGNVVDVVDLDTDKLVGQIPNTNGVHGIAVANDLGKGFISAGRDNQVVIFDLKTLATTGTAKTGTNPDGILYEPETNRVFTFNGRSQNSTVIDAKTGSVLKTIDLGGKPEFPTTDGKGNVFVNMEDKNEIIHLDAKTLEVKAHWSIAPAESPSGMAIDTAQHRLFSVCDGKVMAVVNYETGKVVTTVPIGDGPDAAAYDPGIHTAFSSNGEGTLTVIKVEPHDKYLPSTVETKKGARTMALDLKTHKVYLSSADYGAAPAGTAGRPASPGRLLCQAHLRFWCSLNSSKLASMWILVAEDEPLMAELLVQGLEEQNHTVTMARDGDEALCAIATSTFDAIVLDVMMPRVNGFEVARRTRANKNPTPILMLTARDAPEDIVAGLDAGADDYLVKPFAFSVLTARLRAISRRSVQAPVQELVADDLYLDPATREVRRGNKKIGVTPTEFRLLEALMRRSNRAVSRSSIIEAVWGFNEDVESNTVDVYIKLLREKVDTLGNKRLIHTVRGFGYILRD